MYFQTLGTQLVQIGMEFFLVKHKTELEYIGELCASETRICCLGALFSADTQRPDMRNRRAACSCSCCRRTVRRTTPVRHRTERRPVDRMSWRWRTPSMGQPVRRRQVGHQPKRNRARRRVEWRPHSRQPDQGLEDRDRAWRRPQRTGRQGRPICVYKVMFTIRKQ